MKIVDIYNKNDIRKIISNYTGVNLDDVQLNLYNENNEVANNYVNVRVVVSKEIPDTV